MQPSQIESEARREIFLKLCRAESLKYSDLKPVEMESNHFAYHLKKLLEEGYIYKDSVGLYRLATKGLRLAGQISFRLEGVREQPKVITVVDVISSDGTRRLVLRRRKQPHIGKLVLPGGKIHFGEDLKGAAVRTLKELLPQALTELRYSGSFSLRFRSAKSYYSHIIGFTYSVKLTNEQEEVISDNLERTDDVFWSLAGKEEWEDWQPGSKEILGAIYGQEIFNLELNYDE